MWTRRQATTKPGTKLTSQALFDVARVKLERLKSRGSPLIDSEKIVQITVFPFKTA